MKFIRKLLGKDVNDMACFCVLGMHRSGTSCLTGIMQNFDVELGEVFTENLYNKKGNRENGRIVFLNDAVLATNGGAWDKPVAVTHWSSEEASERDAIITQLQSRATLHWGFKDPRALFTLPFWLEAIGEINFIGTFRHPHRVAMSLNSRDDTPLETGWELWYAYNQRLLELAQNHRFPIADFDKEPDDYLDDTLAKLVSLGLDPAKQATARQFFDSGLRNQAASSVADIALPTHVSELYAQLRAYSHES
jgi:hypothetical protein